MLYNKNLSFKYTLQKCKLIKYDTEQLQHKADSLADKMKTNDFHGFCNAIHKKKQNNKNVSLFMLKQNVYDATGSYEIAKMWQDNFNTLLNSVSNNSNFFNENSMKDKKTAHILMSEGYNNCRRFSPL